MAKVFFRYKTTTCLDTPPLVVGSHMNLGSWNPRDGCPLPRWNGKLSCWGSDAPVLLPTDTETEYKYVHYTNGQLVWESLPCNRSLRPSSNSLIVEDEENSLVSKAYVTEPRRYDPKSPTCHTPLLRAFPTPGYSEADRVLIVSQLSPLNVHLTQTGESSWTWSTTREPTPWVESLYESALRAGVNFQWIALGGDCMEGKVIWQEITDTLATQYNVTLVLAPRDILSKFHLFCSGILEPLLHGLIDIHPNDAPQYPSDLWEAYRAVNSLFADVVMNERKEDDLIWIHDYQLMMTPSFLGRRATDPPLNLGMSMHTPFPPCDIFRIFPNREALLNSLLSCDLLSFQSFEFVRHFLSACKRVLGAAHNFKANGLIAVDYFGREIAVKVSYCGVCLESIQEIERNGQWTEQRNILKKEFEGKKVVLGFERIQKASWLLSKLFAFRDYLHAVPSTHIVLVHICILPTMKLSKSLQALLERTKEVVREINVLAGREAVVFKEVLRQDITLSHRFAYYKSADLFWDCSVRGFSPMVVEFAMSNWPAWRPIVLSPFSILSTTMKSAYSVNPFNYQEMLDAFQYADWVAPNFRPSDLQEVSLLCSHSPLQWGQDYLSDLKQSQKNSRDFDFCPLGLGDKLKLVTLRKNFDPLISNARLQSDYKRARNRLILLANEGTLMPEESENTPKHKANVVSALEELCKDERNSIYVLSDREKSSLDDLYSGLKNLGLVAEQGSLIKDRYTGFNWQKLTREVMKWKVLAEDVIDVYVGRIEGARKEVRETMVLFVYKDADPDYGSLLAKELLSHLELVLQPFSEDCELVTGLGFIEVKPIGCDKGAILSKVSSMISEKKGPIDFVICIGDSLSDESMFKVIHEGADLSVTVDARMIACTVGMKPSLAAYYLMNVAEVGKIVNVMKDFSVKTKSSYSYNDCSEIFQGRSIGDGEKPIMAVSISCAQVASKHKHDLFSRDDDYK